MNSNFYKEVRSCHPTFRYIQRSGWRGGYNNLLVAEGGNVEKRF